MFSATGDREGDISAVLVETNGNIPSPRVGHSSAIIGSVLIVWGGDTKTSFYPKTADWLDDGLYLLNLSTYEYVQLALPRVDLVPCTVTREWTKALTSGPVPGARYGHRSAMAGSVFLVFGGQVGSTFLNDLWAFDLQSRTYYPGHVVSACLSDSLFLLLLHAVRTTATWNLYEPKSSKKPGRRTGHTCISFRGKQLLM